MRLGIDVSNIRSGGGQTHLSELLRVAQPQEHGITRVTVWAGQKTLQKISARPWLEVIHDPMLDQSLPVRLYWQATKLSRLAESTSDVLFVPGGLYLGNFFPFVTMSQNMLVFEKKEAYRYWMSLEFIRLLLLRLNQTRTFRRANGIIFLTKYACLTILKQIGPTTSQWTIIPHGIDKRFYLPPREQKVREAYSHDNPFRFLYISIVNVYKHQWHVAEAVAQLRQTGFPVVLELIGPAYRPAWDRLRQVMRELDPNQEFIYYRGLVPFAKLHSFYHQADSFIFASSCENMPNILMEAMSSGLPIACSQRGPMPEILGDAGIYFDPEQPEQIASALLTLIDNPALRQRYAQLAFERAQAYSWERCAGETFSFIAEVAQSSRNGKRT